MWLQTHNILRNMCHTEAHCLMTMQPLQHISNVRSTAKKTKTNDVRRFSTSALIVFFFVFHFQNRFFCYTATVCVLRCFGTFVVFGPSFWHAALLRNERLQAMQTAGAFIWDFFFAFFVFRFVSMVSLVICNTFRYHLFRSLFGCAAVNQLLYCNSVCAMCDEKRNDKTDRERVEWKTCANWCESQAQKKNWNERPCDGRRPTNHTKNCINRDLASNTNSEYAMSARVQ